MKEKKKESVVAHRIDKITETYLNIPLDGSISVLTGSNGSGKSLIRGQLRFREEMKGKTVAHASMQIRTSIGGVCAAFTNDTSWNPTSVNTFNLINAASNSVRDGYLVLDEIEVGCSEETLMGLVAWINANIPERIKGSKGCLVITHSRYVVQHLKFDHKNWFNLDGYKTPEEWLNREIVPVDLEKLQKDSHELFLGINALKGK